MGRGPAVIVENRGKTQKSMVLRAGVPQKYLTNARNMGKLLRVQKSEDQSPSDSKNPRTKVHRISKIRQQQAAGYKGNLEILSAGGQQILFRGDRRKQGVSRSLAGTVADFGAVYGGADCIFASLIQPV